MNIVRIGALATTLAVTAGAALSEPLKLEPANPQPSGLKSGLNVKYAWGGAPPAGIQSVTSAKSLLQSGAEPGKPLRGLDYRDTRKGDPVLTHPEHYNVAADISGYIRFDAPGVYELETWSNDGVETIIGGHQVSGTTGRQPCRSNVRSEVEVPQAGWYELKMVYFQKYSTACLMMKWGKSGEKLKWVPNDVFGRK
ncbi:PA14 domain-containing protein [Ruegeria atlantica]|uniref:PA14 domain-containing protein n=1 Tax=Ruegeria atlantica TaxID=81569 RepID=UPI00147DAA13|nr:PA14 domain-containing protein [Ruegeria atlantica]